MAQTLVEIDLATELDWIAAGKAPAALVHSVFRRFLRDHVQETIAEHFELSLTLGESIVDSTYSDSGADSDGQLFLVLNTQSSFPLGIGKVVETGKVSSRYGRGFVRRSSGKPCIAGYGSTTI